jgi:hypothetical protein
MRGQFGRLWSSPLKYPDLPLKQGSGSLHFQKYACKARRQNRKRDRKSSKKSWPENDEEQSGKEFQCGENIENVNHCLLPGASPHQHQIYHARGWLANAMQGVR